MLMGYKINLTETCEMSQPYLISYVLIPATTPNGVMSPTV
jgi:hypothetical protein